MKKLFVKLSIFCALCVVGSFGLDVGLRQLVIKNSCNKIHWQLRQTNIKFDIGFLGSSRVLCTINPNAINTEKQVVANLGLNGTGFKEQWMYLNLLLQNGYQFKQVLIQVDVFSMNSEFYFKHPFREWHYYPYIKNQIINAAIYENKSGLDRFSTKNIPIYKWGVYNSEFNFINLIRNQCTKEVDEHGALLLKKKVDFLGIEEVDEIIFSVDSTDLRYLSKITALLKQEEIDFAFFTAPSHPNLQALIKNLPEFENFIIDFSYQVDCTWFNFADSIQSDSLFNDWWHLNENGTIPFSKQLKNRLNNIE